MSREKSGQFINLADWAKEVLHKGWAEKPDYSEKTAKYFSPPGGGLDSPRLELPPPLPTSKHW